MRIAQPFLHSRKTRLGRSVAAQKYLRGQGVEIGAFAQPTLVPPGSRTLYIDRVSASHWASVPEYVGVKCVKPDVIDDGLTLSTQADNSFDYLVASHMLEHADDPILALRNWVRVVKPGGHILVIVPDKRFTMDRKRPLTSFEHLVRDHEHGPAVSADDHYRDIAANCMDLTNEEAIAAVVRQAEPAVHFHTWTVTTFTEFLLAANHYLGDVYELLEAKLNVGEALCVLRVN